jgi:PKD repeat protein
LTANAYDGEPRGGGIALSLELASYFCISRRQQGMLQYPALPPPPPQTTPGIYSTNITLPPDPRAGQYGVYVLGQAIPAGLSSASTSFNVQDSTGYPPQTSFVFWPATPYMNVTVNFDASSSTAEGLGDKITKYEWDFGDGTPRTIKTGNPPNPTADHTYQQTGTFIIVLNVTDNEGLWSTASKPIKAIPERAWPTANFTWTPENPLINETITFDASSSTTGWSEKTQSYSPIQNYTWDFGDGNNKTTLTPTTTHNYTSLGSYTVQLAIVDADGRTNMTTALVQVLNATIKIYDFNGDGVIDMKDIRRVAKAFGATPGSPNWDPVVDTNGDGVIDMKDIRPVAKNFGKDP